MINLWKNKKNTCQDLILSIILNKRKKEFDFTFFLETRSFFITVC